MIEIRKARDGEEHQVLDFYYQLVDTMKGTPYCPKWEKVVYPVLSDIAGAIGANTLYVATENHEIIGAFKSIKRPFVFFATFPFLSSNIIPKSYHKND